MTLTPAVILETQKRFNCVKHKLCQSKHHKNDYDNTYIDFTYNGITVNKKHTCNSLMFKVKLL